MSEIPQRHEVIDHLRSVAQAGPVDPMDSAHGALYGASMETVFRLVDMGSIRGERRGGESRRSIFVAPTVGLIYPAIESNSSAVMDQLFDPEEIREMARVTAQVHSKEDAFLSILGLPLGDEEIKITAHQVMDDIRFRGINPPPPSARYFMERGVLLENIDFAMQEAKQRSGFLLGISPAIQEKDDIETVKAEKNDSNMFIRTSGLGIPYKFISGIEPLGPVEELFISDLLK